MKLEDETEVQSSMPTPVVREVFGLPVCTQAATVPVTARDSGTGSLSSVCQAVTV